MTIWFQTSGLQQCVGINYCCFQPPSFGDCFGSHWRLIHHQQWRANLSLSLSSSVSKFFSMGRMGKRAVLKKKNLPVVVPSVEAKETLFLPIWDLHPPGPVMGRSGYSPVSGEIGRLHKANHVWTGLDLQHSLSALEPRGGDQVLQQHRLPCGCH